MQLPRLLSIAIAVSALASVHAADAKPKAKQKTSAKQKAPSKNATAKQNAAAAKTHIDAATKAHKDGKFDVALTELQIAYDLTPEPKLLFAIAQVQAKLGDCSSAVDNYTKFLDSTKDEKKASIVQQAISACKSTDVPAVATTTPVGTTSELPPGTPVAVDTAATPPPSGTTATTTAAVTTTGPAADAELPPTSGATPPTPSPSPPASAPPPVEEPPRAIDTPRHRAFYKDPLGDALVVGGVVAGVFAFVEFSAARGALDDADNATTLDAYNQLVDDAHSKRNLSLILAGGSVALIGAGVVRFAMHKSTESHHVAVVPSSGGGLVTWSGGF